MALAILACSALAGVRVIYGIGGHVVTSALDHHVASNPLTKEVIRVAGA